jgi:integration host factor subunit alpha
VNGALPEDIMNKALTKADIVEVIYEKTERNRLDVKNTVEALLNLIKHAIKKDHTLLISGFGKLEAYDKHERRGRNPQTDESIMLSPRKVVVFRLSRKFRAELNGNEYTGPDEA